MEQEDFFKRIQGYILCKENQRGRKLKGGKKERKIAIERMKSEREKREEERQRAKERRRQKLEKHRILQEAWLTLRWISDYIDENEELWEFERLEMEVERRR